MATTGLQGVSPHRSELIFAQQVMNYDSVPVPRYLERSEWRSTLDRIIERIGPAARETCYSIGADHCEKIAERVHIVDDPSINAYVDSNNVVSVHSGLLHLAASDEEIAAVLAHEYGHVFADHIAKKYHNVGVGLLGALVISFLGEYGDADSETTNKLATDVIEAAANANSPEFELEADFYSALILERAGIDLKHGRYLLVRLARASDHATTTQSGWGDQARLMATTHPANDYRIARWMAVSETFDWSRELDHPADDTKLRIAAIGDLLDTPIFKGKLARWINTQNGHSGTMTIIGTRDMHRCRTPQYHSVCVKYRQRDSTMDFSGAEVRFFCTIPTDLEDETSWEWTYMGNSAPWKLFRNGCPQVSSNE